MCGHADDGRGRVLTLRAAGARDAAAIGALHAVAWQQTYAEILPDTNWVGLADDRAAMWRQVLDDPTAHNCLAVLIVEEDDRLIGFGCCSRQHDPALADAGYGGEINALYVLRSHQRRGAGRALMAALARALIGAGHAAASLWVVRENHSARQFYDALGGGLIDEREGQHGGVTLHELAYGWRDLSLLID